MRLLLTLASLSLAFSSTAKAQTVHAATTDETAAFWRTTQNCGANCLFLLLRARGHELAYSDVLDATPIGPRGSTLPEIVAAAEQLGFNARIGKGSPSDLRRATLPIMIHLDSSTGDVRAPGHYVLVTQIDNATSTLHLFDGLSALKTTIPLNELQRTWSGFVLEIEASSEWRYKVFVSILALFLGVWIFVRRSSAVRATTCHER